MAMGIASGCPAPADAALVDVDDAAAGCRGRPGPQAVAASGLRLAAHSGVAAHSADAAADWADAVVPGAVVDALAAAGAVAAVAEDVARADRAGRPSTALGTTLSLSKGRDGNLDRRAAAAGFAAAGGAIRSAPVDSPVPVDPDTDRPAV